MALAFYKLIVRLYGMVIHMAAPFNAKAKQWVVGRKDWYNSLNQNMANLGSAERYWFHCASYGEFEQGRPLIEAVKLKHPSSKIILSFFSPSGYEAFKNWPGADVIVYLPLDTPSNAKRFLDLVKPGKTFIIKYEYWLCFLKELKKRKSASYLVSATFKPKQVFFKWYGGIFRKSLQTFTTLFIQDKASLQLLNSIHIQNAVLSGDTRIDRVLAIKAENFQDQKLQDFVQNSFVLVAGSTWPQDDKFIAESVSAIIQNDLKLIVAPHELHESSLRTCIETYSKIDASVSTYSKGIKANSRVVILDTMGMLSKVYRLGTMAYVGGGFGTGIHNILEPAVYGIPVGIAGYGHEKYNEAIQLMQLQIAFHFDSAEQLRKKIQFFKTNPQALSKLREEAMQYFEANKNVTERILAAL